MKEGGAARTAVPVYDERMPVPKTSGTLQEFMESLVAHLGREPKDEEERQQIEAEKTALRNAFIRMASMPKIHVSRYSFPLSLKAQIMIRRAGEEVEPKPLPPLPPGKARVVSF